MTLLMKVKETVSLMDKLSFQKRMIVSTLNSSPEDEQKTNGTEKSSDDSLKSIATIRESLSILKTTFDNS